MIPEGRLANVNGTISSVSNNSVTVSIEHRIQLCQECIHGVAASGSGSDSEIKFESCSDAALC